MHNWDDFRYFYSVASHGSFSAAAQTLGVNHSTVARRIQALEDRHGVRLLERTASGYALTDAGTAAFEVIQDMYDCVQKTSRVLQGKDTRLEGRLNITMPHDLYESCLSVPLMRFQKNNPMIDMHLNLRHGLRNLANREADIAVRISPAPPSYLIGKCLTTIQHGLYQSQHLNAHGPTPIIGWGSSSDDETLSWANTYYNNPKIVLRIDDLASMYAAVKSGMGIARMPCFYPDAQKDKSVRRLPVDVPRSNWGIWLLNHIDLRDTARVNHCKQFLAQEIRQLVPLFEGKQSLLLGQ